MKYTNIELLFKMLWGEPFMGKRSTKEEYMLQIRKGLQKLRLSDSDFIKGEEQALKQYEKEK